MAASHGLSSWPFKLWQERLTLFAVPFLLFAESLGFGLLGYDDKTYYFDNGVLCGGQWQGLADLWKEGFYSDYFPITQFTLWLDLHFAGTESWVFARLHGMFWIGLGILGVHALLLRVTQRRGLSFGVALLFALHPVAAPAVLWLAERKNQVCMAFSFWCVERYVAARQEPERARALRKGAASFVLLALALLSKVHAVTIPVMMASYEIALGEGLWRRRMAWLAPFVLGTAAFLAANVLFIRNDLGNAFLGGSRVNALFSDGPILLRYLEHTFVPLRLSFFYAVEELSPASPWTWIAWLFFLSAMAAGVWAAGREYRRLVLFGWLFGLAALAPTLNMMAQTLPMMDHYNHWALPGWLLVIALAAVSVLERLKSAGAARGSVALCAAAAIGLGVLSLMRVQEFSSPMSLFGTAAERQPGSSLACAQYAIELWSRHEPGREDETGAAALKALGAPDANRILPAARSTLIVEAAAALKRRGEAAEAEALLEREVAKFPPGWAAVEALARARFALQTGDPPKAVTMLAPVFAGPLADAAAKLRLRCRHGPELPHEIAPLVILKFSSGDGYDRAFSRRMRLDQLNVLAQAYAMCGENERAFDVAAVLVNTAPEYPPYRGTLAEAYRRLGQPELAGRTVAISRE